MDTVIRRLGRVDYVPTWEAMQAFTASRTPETPDELWIVEHPPVFTLGQAGKPEHLLQDVGIPVVKIDRGGQITYHGPGQVVIYLLLDLHRLKLKVREMVRRIEQAVIDLLATHGLAVNRRDNAPGVYLGEQGEGAKIAALGLRVKNGCTYHGLSLNVDMDLAPFAAINPCGYPGLAVTQTRDHHIPLTPQQAGEALCQHLLQQLQRQQPERT
ncbi:lipoyl(octanoyl) transferase LipB [Azovibrio restrictus]|uniref:lipoyl(octanoyl) transferase LipB n=1 Tax=Azovibrio restrictus TaxID=146938 RepID=UPI0026F179E3|nr:lipoyl(octanoyl) transferase LipB [Azovibrio restrictus]